MRMTATAIGLAVVVVAAAGGATGAAAQSSDTEAAMIAAGEWAMSRLPQGSLRLDPHRTGRSTDPEVAGRVASALGAELGTLEETRRCDDALDGATCRLGSAALIAIAAPAIRGDRARVRVYVWYRQEDARNPVAKGSWEVSLRRTGGGWEIAGGRTLD